MIGAVEIHSWIFWALVCVINLLLAGFFAGMETGIYVLNNLRIELHAETGSRPGRTLQKMLRRPNRLLSVLLTGTNIHHYIATFSISTMFILAGMGDDTKWYSMAVATPLLFIFADSLPKHLYRRQTETFVYSGTRILAIADILFHITGLAFLVEGVSSGLMRLMGKDSSVTHKPLSTAPLAIVAEAHASGVLSMSQAIMADRIMRIPSITLLDIMIPIQQSATAPLEVTRDDFVSGLAGHEFSRIPLIDAEGHVAGTVNIYDVLTDNKLLAPADLRADPFLLPGGMNITAALPAMRKSHNAIAIITGPGNRHIGLVTIKDVVEEIVGELEAW